MICLAVDLSSPVNGIMRMPHATEDIEPDRYSIGSLWASTSLLLYPLAGYRLTLVAGRKCQKASQNTTTGVFRTHDSWKDSHLLHMCDASHERILILINNHYSTAGDH